MRVMSLASIPARASPGAPGFSHAPPWESFLMYHEMPSLFPSEMATVALKRNCSLSGSTVAMPPRSSALPVHPMPTAEHPTFTRIAAARLLTPRSRSLHSPAAATTAASATVTEPSLAFTHLLASALTASLIGTALHHDLHAATPIAFPAHAAFALAHLLATPPIIPAGHALPGLRATLITGAIAISPVRLPAAFLTFAHLFARPALAAHRLRARSFSLVHHLAASSIRPAMPALAGLSATLLARLVTLSPARLLATLLALPHLFARLALAALCKHPASLLALAHLLTALLALAVTLAHPLATRGAGLFGLALPGLRATLPARPVAILLARLFAALLTLAISFGQRALAAVCCLLIVLIRLVQTDAAGPIRLRFVACRFPGLATLRSGFRIARLAVARRWKNRSPRKCRERENTHDTD
jgi:hypothetical protein